MPDRRHPDEAPMPDLAMPGTVEATVTRDGKATTVRPLSGVGPDGCDRLRGRGPGALADRKPPAPVRAKPLRRRQAGFSMSVSMRIARETGEITGRRISRS
jgi:hypothetical protein